MRIHHHAIHATQLLDAAQLPSDTLHAIRARGRGGRLQVPPGWISACLVLEGKLDLNGQEADWQLSAKHLQLWLDGPLRCTSRGACWWIVITGPARLWSSQRTAPPVAVEIFPWETACPRDIARPLVHLSRPRWFPSPDTDEAGDALGVLRDAIGDHQQFLQTCLHRCSGRTLLRRQQTLLRLLRVQHLIRSTLDGRMELSRLAASANYSPCHLIRVYREVFGETPSEYAARLRCERAWRLVCDTGLSVCEIAETLGFESESAFCRAFKHAFGCTTSEVRRGVAASCPTRFAPVEPACTA